MTQEVLGQKSALFLSNIEAAIQPSKQEIDELVAELTAYNKEAFLGYEKSEIEHAIICLPTGVQKGLYSGTYIEEKTTNGVINAIKNYINDEKWLKEELEYLQTKDESTTKTRLTENALNYRKYKRDAAYWKAKRENIERIRKKLCEGDPLFDPKLRSDPAKCRKALKTAGDPENDPFRDPDEPVVKIKKSSKKGYNKAA
jgi:hypothetical protein